MASGGLVGEGAVDWNPAWLAEWQRHYAAVRELLRDEQDTEILPGTTVHGLDVGRWAARHQEHTVWHPLMDGQRERLERLRFAPRPAKPEAAVKAPKGRSDAFERGLRLARYRARTGSALDPMPGQAPASYVVPRDHVWAAAWMEHQAWLTEPGVPPGKRNTGFDQARVYASTWEGYRNAWDLLEQPTSQCPVRLPQAWRAWVDDPRVGLPPGHPWGDVLPDWQAVEGS
ncbi:helicase associated domain-containing protein [Streptomyces sp. NPDC048253]|uniref:helicase associated domain-containing protein n=1 Tax=Streptomyces sp. NPDC048253 TaxID=3365524 RepID=UPI0037167F4D